MNFKSIIFKNDSKINDTINSFCSSDASFAEDKKELERCDLERWDYSNCTSLMMIKRGILEDFKGTMPNKITNAKGFLEDNEKCFIKNDKAETSMLMENLISMRYKVKEMQKVPYASIVGSLMYAQVCTRMDLAYIVGMIWQIFE